jgi:hypothetical protein
MIYVTPWLFGILAAILLLLCALSGESGDDLIRVGLVFLAWIAIAQVIKIAVNGQIGKAVAIGMALFFIAGVMSNRISSHDGIRLSVGSLTKWVARAGFTMITPRRMDIVISIVIMMTCWRLPIQTATVMRWSWSPRQRVPWKTSYG